MTIHNEMEDKKVRSVRIKMIAAVITALLVTGIMLFLVWERTANPKALWPNAIWLLLLFVVVGGVRGLKRKANKTPKNTHNSNKWP
jgi:uncharacterized membrane protein YqhA